jgi:Cyanate lyase C-terminal domain
VRRPLLAIAGWYGTRKALVARSSYGYLLAAKLWSGRTTMNCPQYGSPWSSFCDRWRPHEEFGDGIMSAIDFSMNISREADPKGDRVKVIMSGKCLPYENLLSERRAPTPLPARHAWWVVRPAHSSKPELRFLWAVQATHLEGQ